MPRITPIQACASVCLLAIAGCAVVLTIHAVRLVDAWATLPGQVTQLRAAVQKLPQNIIPLVLPPVLAEVDKQASGIRRDTRRDTLTQVTEIRDMTLTRLDTALHLVDTRSAEALGEVTAARKDVDAIAAATVINENAIGALTKDAQDSWDDSYNDVRSLLQSGEVVTTQAAQTLQTINAKAPTFTADVDGMAADFHDATHSLDLKFFHPPPRTPAQKLRDFFEVYLPALLLAIARGGAF